MLGRFTSEDMTLPLACMVLLDAHFWPDARWILWDETRGYASSGIQLGRTERDPRNVDTLLAELRGDAVEPPPELLDRFEPLFVDERKLNSRPRTNTGGPSPRTHRLTYRIFPLPRFVNRGP